MIGPICSERTIGPQAQSLLTGSHETETKKPMSSSDSMYDDIVLHLISQCVPSEHVCNDDYVFKNIVKITTVARKEGGRYGGLTAIEAPVL